MHYAPIRDTITVTGTGTVAAIPDTARITLGVSATHATSLHAHESVANDAARLLKALQELGIGDRDIGTSGMSVNAIPKYDETNTYVGISGYEVSTQLTVRVREVDSIGKLLDVAVASGASHVHGISFEVSEPDPFARQARSLAVADARDRADQIAAAGELDVTGVYAITESAAPFSGAQDMPMAGAKLMMRSATEMPMRPGETEVRVQVEAVFAVAPRQDS